MVNENESGEDQNSSDAPEVKSEQANEAAAETITEPVEIPVEIPVLDPDEKILNDILESGKNEVTTSELITAGFDTSRMAQYSFSVGQFKLTRLLLISPYKIEKVN